MRRVKDRTGKRYGRLTVIEYVKNNKYAQAMWLCRCDCGNITTVSGGALHSKGTQSCGCLAKERQRESVQLSKGEASFNGVIAKMKINAKTRGYEFALTKEQVRILTKQNCHYCGAIPNNRFFHTGNNGDYIYNGLDRIENTKGYTIDNVVPCCIQCNRSKTDMTIKEFESWVQRVYKHFGSNHNE